MWAIEKIERVSITSLATIIHSQCDLDGNACKKAPLEESSATYHEDTRISGDYHCIRVVISTYPGMPPLLKLSFCFMSIVVPVDKL